MSCISKKLIFLMILFCGCSTLQKADEVVYSDKLEYRQGAICRGLKDNKEMALVFTGGSFGEGLETILDELKARNIKAGFFFTGEFFEIDSHKSLIRRLVKEGHYLGPHSDKHLLLASWDDGSTQVTKEEFTEDLLKNIDRCVKFGFKRKDIRYWIPPFEHINEEVCGWAREAGIETFNFSRGTLSSTDWAPESYKGFRPSERIIKSIRDYPSKDTYGYNGFIMLMHVGAGERKDKLHYHFSEILDLLRDYKFTRIDYLLDKGICNTNT